MELHSPKSITKVWSSEELKCTSRAQFSMFFTNFKSIFVNFILDIAGWEAKLTFSYKIRFLVSSGDGLISSDDGR